MEVKEHDRQVTFFSPEARLVARGEHLSDQLLRDIEAEGRQPRFGGPHGIGQALHLADPRAGGDRFGQIEVLEFPGLERQLV